MQAVRLLVGDPWKADVNTEGFNPYWARATIQCAVISEKKNGNS